MKTLKTALIGLGRIGWNFHRQSINNHNGFQLVAVVDPLEERRNEALAEGDDDLQAFATCEELFLANVKPDLVVIASPTHFHERHVILAFANGCDVFCDKPLAVSYKEARRIEEAAKKHQRKIMVYQPHRATAEFMSLRDVLKHDLIGDIHLIQRFASGFTRRNDWQSRKEFGGGMLRNYGAHYLDQLLTLSDVQPRRLLCLLKNVIAVGDAEDYVKIILEMEDDSLRELEINMASASSSTPWRVLGKRGSVTLTPDKTRWLVRHVSAEDLGDVKPQAVLAAANRKYGDGTSFEWREESFDATTGAIDFYATCHDYFAFDKPPFVPLTETMTIMKLFTLCEDSNSSGTFVSTHK